MHLYYNPYSAYLKDKRIELISQKSVNGNEILIFYLHPKDEYVCPICSSIDVIKYGIKNRIIKLPIFKIENTVSTIRVHRMRCNSCGKMFMDESESIPKNSNISLSVKLNILYMLKDRVTFSYVAKENDISVNECVSIFDSCVDTPRQVLSETLCFDEIKNIDSATGNYAFIILDPINERLVDILEDRRSKALENYFYKIDFKERSKVKYIVTDMYEPYKIIINTFFKNAIEVIDEFHYVRYMTDAFNTVRIKTMNKYKENDPEYKILKKYWNAYMIRKNKINESFSYYNPIQKRKTNLYKIIDDGLNISNDLTESYYLLQEFYSGMDSIRYEESKEWFDGFIIKLLNSGITEFMEVGRTYIHWEKEILNSFIRFGDKRLNNGPIEGMNSYLKELIKISHGFKSFDIFRKRLMYTMNKDIKIRRQ